MKGQCQLLNYGLLAPHPPSCTLLYDARAGSLQTTCFHSHLPPCHAWLIEATVLPEFWEAEGERRDMYLSPFSVFNSSLCQYDSGNGLTVTTKVY